MLAESCPWQDAVVKLLTALSASEELDLQPTLFTRKEREEGYATVLQSA